MEWTDLIITIGFALAGIVCVLLVAVSLPGTWIMLAIALVMEIVAPTAFFGWRVLVACLVLAVLGEVLEFIAGALGAKHGGGTRRGMIGAIIGGFLGSVLFTVMVPIPPIGTLIGAVVGTFAGAVIAEVSGASPMTVHGSMRPAVGATIGRVLGTVGKVGIAFAIWIVLVVAAFWP